MSEQLRALKGQNNEEDKAAVLAQRVAKKAAKKAKKEESKHNDSDAAVTSPSPPMASPAPEAGEVDKVDNTLTITFKAEDDTAAAQTRRGARKGKAAGVKEGAAEGEAPSLLETAVPVTVADAGPNLRKSPRPSPFEPAAVIFDITGLHPHVVELGLLFRSLRIVGGNARAIALMDAMRDVVTSTPSLAALHSRNQVFELISKEIQRNCDYLATCREFSVGMLYLIKLLRERICESSEKADSAKSDPRKVAERDVNMLCNDILQAVHDLSVNGQRHIVAKDVILVYGRSSAIELMLLGKAGTEFQVCVVDSAPLYEGRGLLWKLQQRSISCCYVLLPAVCAIMPRATKVFIGASAVLQSGEVMSRAGTAMVALVARRYRKPVLCFCESYKFTDKMWMGSLTMNQSTSANSRGAGQGLMYDLTPVQFIDVLTSEVSTMHPSAVAAAIRGARE